jgi:hypothetical protein
MIARQWQLGELTGDDAGSAAFAKLHVATTRLTTYTPGERPEQPFDDTVPLETRVEQRPVPFTAGARELALDLRTSMGRYWQKLLAKEAGLDVKYASDFRRAFGIRMPDPTTTADAPSARTVKRGNSRLHSPGATDGYAW